jgi:hypothetical protein
MSKISMPLLKIESDNWLGLKKSTDSVPNAKIPDFGKYMNDKYAFLNEALSNETDHNIALLLIMRDHVQEIK